MHSIMFSLGICLIWAVSLFNETGIGEQYQIYKYAGCIIVLISVCMYIWGLRKRFDRNSALFYICVFVVFVLMPWTRGYGIENWTFLCSFLLIYIMARVNVATRAMKCAGLAVGALGMIILLIFNLGAELSGWNANRIAMIGLFSFLTFIIPFSGRKSLLSSVILAAVSIYYFYMIFLTESRSCCLILIVALLFVVFVRDKESILTNKGVLVLCLLLPLIIAVAVCIVSQMSFMEQLNDWSLQNFDKTVFNGRDESWITGFQTLWEHPIMGCGNYLDSIQHNSAITCLSNFGIAGYVLWIAFFYRILIRSRYYIYDNIVKGCLLAFLLMYTQQSVELGIINHVPELMIYLPLGLMLGRIKYIKECERNGRDLS